MADELMFIKKTTLTDIGNSVRQKLGTSGSIKVTELSQKILEIPTGGGIGDLIDVETFPTTNVQDDKVYRAEVETNATYELYMYDSASGTASSLGQEAISSGITLNYYEMNSTAEVESPLETNPDGSNVWNIYIEKPTGIAYIYYGGTWVTFGGLILGDPTNTSFDKGYTTDPSTLTEDGVYVYKISGGIYTGIGVPNANDNKKVFTWNGEKWGELKAIKIVKNIPTVGETGMLYFREKVPYPCIIADNGSMLTWSEFVTAFSMIGGGIQLALEQIIICDELPTKNIIEQQTNGLYGEIVFTFYALYSNDTWQIWQYTAKDGWEQFSDEAFRIGYFNEAWIWNGVRFVKVWRENFYFTDTVVNGAEFISEHPSYVGELSVIKPKIGDLYEHEPDASIVSPTKDDVTYIVKELYNDFTSYKYTSQFTVAGYGDLAVDKDEVTPIFSRTSTVFRASDYYNGTFNPPDYCFYHYTNLQTVYLQSGLSSIGAYAFAECTNLTSIIYDGTKSGWKARYKGENWDLNTGNYIITCTDGTIAKDGTET